MINPETNRFEKLFEVSKDTEKANELVKKAIADGRIKDMSSPKLLRPDGSPVPDHWPIFSEGEEISIKGYTFKVKAIGEDYLLFEPVGPLVILGGKKQKVRRRGKRIIKR